MCDFNGGSAHSVRLILPVNIFLSGQVKETYILLTFGGMVLFWELPVLPQAHQKSLKQDQHSLPFNVPTLTAKTRRTEMTLIGSDTTGVAEAFLMVSYDTKGDHHVLSPMT